jgi:hypothetical protein
MRTAAIWVLAGCVLIACSSCDADARNAERRMRAEVDDVEHEDAADLANVKAVVQDMQDAKTEVVRLTEFPGGLELEKKLRPEDQKLEVEIYGARTRGVSGPQRHALDEFVANEKQIFRAVREAIYRQYREKYLPHREQMRSMLRQTASLNGYSPERMEKMGMDEFPEIKTGNELDHLVTLLSISVHRPVNGISKIGIFYQSHLEWDEGLGVRIAGTAVEAIGTGVVSQTD